MMASKNADMAPAFVTFPHSLRLLVRGDGRAGVNYPVVHRTVVHPPRVAMVSIVTRDVAWRRGWRRRRRRGWRDNRGRRWRG